MKIAPIPSRLQPKLVTRLWGRRRPHALLPSTADRGEPIGEIWLSGEDCRFATGPLAGLALGEAWERMPEAWRGSLSARRGARGAPACGFGSAGFPLLAKFLFPETKFSIQVHPDDDYAARHEAGAGGCGKTEMWHAVTAEPGAEGFVGLEPGSNLESLRRALSDGTLEARLRRIPIAAGDTIYVPAGTVHTVGSGVVLCEIQEYSDVTYRLFDYGRVDAAGKPRELHVEKALEVIAFGPSRAGKTRPATGRRGPLEVAHLAACRYFAAERWRFAEPVAPPASRTHFDLLVILAGAGAVACGEDGYPYHAGEAWFVPAEAASYRFEPEAATTLLRAYVPDLEALRRDLVSEGLTPEQTAGFLFE